MQKHTDRGLMSRMFALQADMLHADGLKADARGLALRALALLWLADPGPKPSFVPARVRRR